MAEGAVQVQGVREVQRILKQIDAKAQRQTQAMMRKAAAPMVARAKSATPAQAPLSGWAHSGRTGWRTSEIQSKIKATTGGRAIRKNQTWPLISLIQGNAAGMIYDWAGRSNYTGRKPRSAPYPGRPRGHLLNGQGRNLVNTLPRLGATKGSEYSRVLFPSYVATRDQVVDAILDGLDQVAKQINREIERV